MKKIITAILVCLVCFMSLAFSSCKKRDLVKLTLVSTENGYQADTDSFRGVDINEFSASLKEIKMRDDEFKVYSTMYDKIISDDVGIYIPADEERITYLGIHCYQPGGIRTNEEGFVDYVEIEARCIFTCGGTEYEASFYTSLSANTAKETKTFKLGGGEAEFVISNGLRKKEVDLCRYKVGDDTVIIKPVNGNFFENTEFTNLPEDIFEFLEIFDLKKVSLKDLIE